jgi:hypothetical protein
MTTCPVCEQELGASNGCDLDELELASGLLATRVRYGSESFFGGNESAERRCGGQALGCDCDHDAGGYSCPTRGPAALSIHRTTPLLDDPEGLHPEADDALDGFISACMACHGELDAAS